MSKIITCEQVSNGHPDKICDQIADAIVTDILQHDRNARVAIECLLKKSQLFIAGEVTTDYRPNYQQIVHDVFNRIEVYTDYKDPDMEATIEEVLTAHELYYEKSEVWIETEKMYEVLYELTV